MLRELLRQLAHSDSVSTTDLASNLRTTPQMVTAMIQDLVRTGYLQPASSKCSGACETCSGSKGCIKGASQEIWTLTRKALDAAESNTHD
jgi:hypothetical protein